MLILTRKAEQGIVIDGNVGGSESRRAAEVRGDDRVGGDVAGTSEVVEQLRARAGGLVPDDVVVTISRNYGETASDKADELLFHLALATVSIVILITLAIGWREGVVVMVVIPTTILLTLFAAWLMGYTINRVSLFALIFSIGILVDDAIVVVENIVRHFRMPANRGRSLTRVAVEAVDEVGNPTILATFTVIAAIVPMAFVSGLMGPYMRPIPIGATAAMVFSLLVAFLVTPWATIRFLKKDGGHGHEIA